MGDNVQVERKLAECKNVDYSFEGSRECDFIQKILQVLLLTSLHLEHKVDEYGWMRVTLFTLYTLPFVNATVTSRPKQVFAFCAQCIIR